MPSAQPQSRLLLVDGHAYAYRAFYAIRHLNSPTGLGTNGIYGFIKMLSKMRQVLHPSHLVVLWDGGLAAERMVALPEYKAQRAPMPDDLDRQITEMVQYLDAVGYRSLVREGVEADDWIATCAQRFASNDFDIVIASSDKDFMQLVCSGVGLFNPNDKSDAVWTCDQVRAKTGVEPHQILDWLSLLGDAVDNIPGVPGVGPKTATELLKQFGSIEGLYARLGEVKSERIRKSLLDSSTLVQRNLQLIRLRTDLECPLCLEDCSIGKPDEKRLRELYLRWGFKTLLKDLGNETAETGELAL